MSANVGVSITRSTDAFPLVTSSLSSSNSVRSSMNGPAVSSWAIQSVCVPFRPTWTRTRRRTRSCSSSSSSSPSPSLSSSASISPRLTFKFVISPRETRKVRNVRNIQEIPLFKNTNIPSSKRPEINLGTRDKNKCLRALKIAVF